MSGLDFDINSMFELLSVEQMILFSGVIIISLLAGLFLGGILFYVSGVRKGKSLVKFRKTVIQPTREDEIYYDTEEENLDKMFDSDELHSALITTKPNLALLDEEYIEPIFEDVIPILDTPVEEQARPDAANIVLNDADFMRLREERKAKVPVLTREEVLSYVSSLSGMGDITISRRKDYKYYDRCYIGSSTFLVLLERREAIKLLIRMHPKSYAALRQKAPQHTSKFNDLGNDWYSWIVSDIDNNNVVVATAIEMAYKYVSQAEYARGEDHKFELKNPELANTKEDKISAFMYSYKVEDDELFMSVADTLNEKYNLDYFSKNEICEFARTIKGVVPASAQDRLGYRPATLKAGERIYAIVFEKSGIVKIIFRADEEYVEHLKVIHPLIAVSAFPESRDWTWYSAIIDDTFTEDSVKSMLIESFNHVAKIHILDENGTGKLEPTKKKGKAK